MRRCVFALIAAAMTLVPAASASAREPILFVHGFSGAAWNWNVMIDRFEADGYRAAELRAISYNSAQSNAQTARELSQEAQQLKAATGARHVDIVTHSMGGLSSRYYLAKPGRHGQRRRMGLHRRPQPRNVDGARLHSRGLVP
jgi:triacylglycerol lipase